MEQVGVMNRKKVLVRVDYNVSNLKERVRIRASVPTIRTLLERGNTIILATHWGRPSGGFDAAMDTQLLIPSIHSVFESAGLSVQLIFIDQTKGIEAAAQKIASARNVDHQTIFLLQNTRFLNAEQSEDIQIRKALARQYAKLADVFVDEAFSLSHRKEATNTEIKEYLPSYYGLRYMQEVAVFEKLRTQPQHPFICLLGGSKLETKLPVIQKLLPIADHVYVGGLLAFTFQAACSHDVGATQVETQFFTEVQKIMQKYPEKITIAHGDYIHYKGQKLGVDVDQKFLREVLVGCRRAKTIFWNGSMGWIEKKHTTGTKVVEEILIEESLHADVVIGGGDTIEGLSKEAFETIPFISTAGGAALEYLAESGDRV